MYMNHAKNKVKWCLRKAKKELKTSKKHRGLVITDKDIDKAREHIKKAEHNIEVTLYLQKGRYSDWCSSTLFYAIYHCFLSILAKHGYESRNQECTFALIQTLIEDGTVNITREEMGRINLFDIEEKYQYAETAVNIREDYQYSTKLSLKDELFKDILDLAKTILDKTKTIIEE
jgi:uncharacterized protein (UPF0332 family)